MPTSSERPKAIEVRGLSKRYSLSGSPRTDMLRETLGAFFQRRSEPRRANDIWALQGVSFDLAPGSTTGLIGANGAGKSTLLKILSRVTAPTAGQALVRGRVGSLLEVGAGFHPELTGRENVFLSGSLLGMRRTEVDRRLDEIVAFAEMGDFMNVPVKRYSSGMYTRLAFSVAAHLRPDVLLVDEVLAVGDHAFQQKCLRHLGSLSANGQTVMLVSHNLVAIQAACPRVLVLNRGQLVFDGPALEALEIYKTIVADRGPQDYHGEAAAPTPVVITGCEFLDGRDALTRTAIFGQQLRVRIRLEAKDRLENPMVVLGLKRGDGVLACNFGNWYDGAQIDFVEGECSLEGWLPPIRLVPDFYEVHVNVWPWGGAHTGEGLDGVAPFAAATCGQLRVVGSPLNASDGVFQVPALGWTLRRGTEPPRVLSSSNPRE